MAFDLRYTTQRLAAIGLTDSDMEQQRLQKRLLVASSAMMSVLAIIWGAVYLALDDVRSALIPLSYGLLSIISITLFARLRRYQLFRSSQLGLSLLLPFFLSLSLGGFVGSSGVVMWSLTCPMGALVFAGARQARGWFMAFLTVLVIALILDPAVRDQASLSETSVVLFAAMNIAGVSTVAFVLLQYFTIQSQAAQATSDALLLNILPATIAETLKTTPDTIAESYEEASVLFADLVDFTPMSAQMPAADLVELLNEVFTFFDEVADELGIEKIKTIGDCYMAAAGVPEPRTDHASLLAEMAVRIHEHMESHTFGGQHLEFRIGIHSGPVIAGVIGIRKFIYDLWGDVVNTASRMESNGEGGVTQVTRETYELIEPEFRCEPKGLIEIKGKGEMEVWRVLGRRARPVHCRSQTP